MWAHSYNLEDSSHMLLFCID